MLTSWLKRTFRLRPHWYVQRKVRRATVAFCLLVKGEGFQIIGSGVLVHRSGVVLTAAHVIQGLATELEKLKEDGKEATTRVLVTTNPKIEYLESEEAIHTTADLTFTPIRDWMHHKHLDLAVVKTGLDPSRDEITALPVNDHRVVRRGEKVGACGYPYGLDPHEGKSFFNSFLSGHVSGVAPIPKPKLGLVQHYLLQMPVNPGNSGGPVFASGSGEVFAVVSRRFQPKGIPSGLAIAVPVHDTPTVIQEAAAL